MANSKWGHKHIAVLGYGVEGQSTTSYFLRHGVQVDVHDLKPVTALPAEALAKHRHQGVQFLTENNAFQDLTDYDLVMRTPTFPPHHSALAPVDPDKISSQATLFLQHWRGQTIGVSGTKGKGTTASLIHHLLQQSGKKAVLGGNIGVPLLDIIDDMNQDTLAVVELSSFQLWDVTVSPHIAVLLMITPEHLEQHHSLANYLQAKQNLLKYQHANDQAVILTDYEYTRQLANGMPAQQWQISKQSVGYGIQITSQGLIDSSRPNHVIVRLADTTLRGFHNSYNLGAALMAAQLAGVDISHAPQWLASYRPLPHRLQMIGQTNQLRFYDDSIATTPEAAIAGIKSFDEPLVVILGGINKQADWSGVVDTLTQENIRGVILVGEDAPRIRSEVSRIATELPTLFQPASYDEAIVWAAQQLVAAGEGVLLLSPGAKSFDQYQDYRDRGQKFSQAVKAFIAQRPHP